MDLKKVLILLITLFLCIGAFFATRLLSDREKPEITISNDKVSIGCKASFDDLLKNASASDNEGIKEFFIEEDNFVDIVNNRKLTYVAIDNNNNVTKEVLYVDVDDEVNNKRIEILQSLEVEFRHDFLISDYFKVKNECGWEFDAKLEVTGMDINKVGSYEIEVKALKENSIPVLNTTLEVKDFETPIIKVYKKEITLQKGERLNFYDLIEDIEDNKDDKDYLYKHIDVSNVNTNIVGKQELTIMVTDSDGKVGKVKIDVIIKDSNQGTTYYPPVNNNPTTKPENNPQPEQEVTPPVTEPEVTPPVVEPEPSPQEGGGETKPENQNDTEVPVV